MTASVRRSMRAPPISNCIERKRRTIATILHLETPLLWIILRPVEGDPPYELASVTADPAEGEAMTETGANLVETVAMPKPMQETIAAFVAEHHVEQVFVKRKRDRANPEALARRGPSVREDRK